MNVETRMYVVDLLESYQKRSKQIELLHYELSHPARVSENEIIGALALAHGDGEGGHPGGHASDKTLYIALNYQARANHVNSDTAEEVVGQLVTLEREQERLEYYVSLLLSYVMIKLSKKEGCPPEVIPMGVLYSGGGHSPAAFFISSYQQQRRSASCHKPSQPRNTSVSRPSTSAP